MEPIGTAMEPIETIVDRVAARYAARVWWSELDDLRQEGWVAALAAQQSPRFDHQRPLHEQRGYLRRAVVVRLSNHLWEQSAPVTGRKNHGKSVAGLVRASVEALYDHEAPDPSEVERAEAWWEEMREQVALVIHGGHNGDIAARWLLGGERPGNLAEELGWPVHRIWRASSAARKRIATDLDLRHAVAVGI